MKRQTHCIVADLFARGGVVGSSGGPGAGAVDVGVVVVGLVLHSGTHKQNSSNDMTKTSSLNKHNIN